MPKVTSLTVQKKNKERINVFLDGEYAFSLAAITAASLRSGQEISQAQIVELQMEDSYERGKEAVMRLLSYRPRSVAEVRGKLKGKEFPEVVIERVLSRLQELDLLSDRAFVRYWIEQRENFRPRSALALRQELMQKGVARELIDEALADLDEDAAAYRAAEKKAVQWGRLSQDEFNNKVGAFLQRRGFSYSIIQNVIGDLWEAHGSSEYEQEWTGEF